MRFLKISKVIVFNFALSSLILFHSCAHDPLMGLLRQVTQIDEPGSDSLNSEVIPKKARRNIPKYQSIPPGDYSYMRVKQQSFKSVLQQSTVALEDDERGENPKQSDQDVAVRAAQHRVDDQADEATPLERKSFGVLERGMPTHHVREILGEPTYIDIVSAPQFGNERWSYVARGRESKEYKVLFERGRLSAWWSH